MESIRIRTPLNVNISVRKASVGRRIVAFLIDMVILIAYYYLLSIVFSLIFDVSGLFLEDDEFAFYDILFTFLLFPALFYSLWMEMLFNGQTVGKMIMGIRVVKLNGYRAGFSEYFTRWVFRLVDFWTGFFVFLLILVILGDTAAIIIFMFLSFFTGIVAVISILRTPNSQRVGDIVAGTTVLKLKEKHSIDITILENVEGYSPAFASSVIIRLSDNDARIIKDTFKAARKNHDRKTLKRLRKKVESVLEIQSDMTDRQFLQTVMKDFNYYTQQL